MCKPVKCPQCGHEFTPERAIKSGAWTPEEDELLLNGYQKERKTIAELSDELNRSQDATRNRLFVSSAAEASLKALRQACSSRQKNTTK